MDDETYWVAVPQQDEIRKKENCQMTKEYRENAYVKRHRTPETRLGFEKLSRQTRDTKSRVGVPANGTNQKNNDRDVG